MSNDTSFVTSELSAEQRNWLEQYDELDSLIGRLYRAAIDAHMVSRGYRMPTSVVPSNEVPDEIIESGAHEIFYWTPVKYSLGSRSYFTCVERPGENGRGGGLGATGGTAGIAEKDLTPEFEGIRTAIDRRIERFLCLPTPQAAADVANIYTGISGQLDPDHGTIRPTRQA